MQSWKGTLQAHLWIANILEGFTDDCQTLFFGAPESLQMVTAAMKLKDAYSLEGKLWPTAGVQPRLIQGIRRRDSVGEGQETTA